MRRRKSESKIIRIQEEARWQPADDLKLKTALEQVNDINLVHQAITFSSYFTSNELESRWNELLFNKQISLSSQYEISLLPNDRRISIVRQSALFSENETTKLQKIGLLENPTEEFFEKILLEDNSTTKIFHWSRSAHCLLSQWQLLFKYNLLNGQVIPHPSQSEHHQDVTSSYDDREINIETESETHSRWNRRKILKLEKEILTLESFLNDTNCCATINGDFTHYEISSDQSTVIIGRGKESDCDLANEINASRIHRRQAEIRICHQKNEYPTFIIRNIGHRVVSVNGLQLLMDDEVDLHHDSLIQVENIDLFFSITPSSF